MRGHTMLLKVYEEKFILLAILFICVVYLSSAPQSEWGKGRGGGGGRIDDEFWL